MFFILFKKEKNQEIHACVAYELFAKTIVYVVAGTIRVLLISYYVKIIFKIALLQIEQQLSFFFLK